LIAAEYIEPESSNTIMLGRVDYRVKVSAEKAGVMLDPGIMEWAGIAAANI
jgi:hypothetical protein|tara:strand:- start:1580 stop:1732 length:153 start_codon:yes stop_codon:yes gene_type:complete